MKNSSMPSPGRVLTTDEVKRLARQLVPRYSKRPAGAAGTAETPGPGERLPFHSYIPAVV
jgi:hypothetical protein